MYALPPTNTCRPRGARVEHHGARRDGRAQRGAVEVGRGHVTVDATRRSRARRSLVTPLRVLPLQVRNLFRKLRSGGPSFGVESAGDHRVAGGAERARRDVGRVRRRVPHHVLHRHREGVGVRTIDAPRASDRVAPGEALRAAEVGGLDLVAGRARHAVARERRGGFRSCRDAREREPVAVVFEGHRPGRGVTARADPVDVVDAAGVLLALVRERGEPVGVARGEGHHRAAPERVGRHVTAARVAQGRASLSLVAEGAAVGAHEAPVRDGLRPRQRAERPGWSEHVRGRDVAVHGSVGARRRGAARSAPGARARGEREGGHEDGPRRVQRRGEGEHVTPPAETCCNVCFINRRVRPSGSLRRRWRGPRRPRSAAR